MNALSLGCGLRGAKALPTVCPQVPFILLFPCCMSMHCLPSLQEQRSILQDVSQPCLLTFKTQDFKLHWLQELNKFGALIFQASCFWDSFFLCATLCGRLSFVLLQDCISLPTMVALIRFCPKPHGCTFYLL